MKAVHVAVAVIYESPESRRVLIAKRADHLHQGGLWEFPGGKVEVGETVERALIREVREELAVDCDPSSIAPLMRIHHHYSDKSVLLDVWTVSRFAGCPQGVEGQPIRWVEPSELCQYDFPEANQAIVRTLMLPTLYIIHSETSQGWGELPDLQAFRKRAALLRLRPFHKTSPDVSQLLLNASRDGLAGYFAEVLRNIPGSSIRVMVPLAVLPQVVSLVGASEFVAGVHLTALEMRAVAKEQVLSLLGQGYLVCGSCHNLEEVLLANALGLNVITLSPVNATKSHPGTPPLGWIGFRELAARADMPVYALGGMTPGDLPRALAHGAIGVAGIGAFTGKSPSISIKPD